MAKLVQVDKNRVLRLLKSTRNSGVSYRLIHIKKAIEEALILHDYGKGHTDEFIITRALMLLEQNNDNDTTVIEELKEESLDLIIAKKLIQLSKSAEERNIEFNVSFKKLKSLWKLKRCQITGLEFQHEPGTMQELNKSIDRLDNSKGYVDDNIIVCTQGLNSRKGALTTEEVVLIYKKLKQKKLI